MQGYNCESFSKSGETIDETTLALLRSSYSWHIRVYF
jgi:hypothetical protein